MGFYFSAALPSEPLLQSPERSERGADGAMNAMTETDAYRLLRARLCRTGHLGTLRPNRGR
jgi:hypothetical protein